MEVVKELEDNEWMEFVAKIPAGNIFQSPDLAEVYRRSKGFEPALVAVKSGGEIEALMASVFVSYGSITFSPITTRNIVTGGPIGAHEAIPILLSAHDEASASRALLTQVRNLEPPKQSQSYVLAGYRWEDHLNFLLDLELGEDELFKTMSKARRKGIQFAERSKLEAHSLDRRNLSAAYALLTGTYDRAKTPLADRSLFEAAVEVLGPRGHLIGLVAQRDGEPCAVRFVLAWGRTLHDWYAGSSSEGREVHADEWLVWELLRRGIQKGFSTFDFGGAGPPGEAYGPREFKRRFGGREINPGRFEKIYRPITSRLAKTAYALWRRWH